MKNTCYCEECGEEIAEDSVYWEDERAYCGQCGSELDMVGDESDLTDDLSRRGAQAPEGTVLAERGADFDADEEDEIEEREI